MAYEKTGKTMKLDRQATTAGFKMAVAGVIAMSAMVFFHLNFGYWAVVTVAAITSFDESATLLKGLMRLLGTLLGAALGYLIATHSYGYDWLAYIIFFITLFSFSLISLQNNIFSYAGLIAGVTTVIVIGVEHNHTVLVGAAVYRTLDVILGIIITVIVSVLVRTSQLHFNDLTHRAPFKINSSILHAALRIAFTATATFILWHIFNIPQGFWITVSCLFIMEESINTTHVKAWLRLLANIFAALLGSIAALTYGQSIWPLMIILCMGFFACGFIIGSKKKYSSLGNTTGIALSIMLLSGFNQHNIFDIVSIRFINVCIGIVIGVAMTHYFIPNKNTQ